MDWRKKLTENDRDNIKQLFIDHHLTIRKIAEKFDMTWHQIAKTLIEMDVDITDRRRKLKDQYGLPVDTIKNISILAGANSHFDEVTILTKGHRHTPTALLIPYEQFLEVSDELLTLLERGKTNA